MKKYLILTLALLVSVSFTTYAQDEAEAEEVQKPEKVKEALVFTDELGAKKGDITAALLFGRGNFLGLPSVANGPGTSSGFQVNGIGPTNATAGATTANALNMVGFDLRYFIKDNIALTLSGGAILSNTPSVQNVQTFYIVPGTSDPVQGNDPTGSNAGWIPSYGSIQADNRKQMNISVGGEYHFPSKRFEKLFPYLGLNLNYLNSQRSLYNPTITYGGTAGIAGTAGTGVIVQDIGVRSSVVQGMGAQAVAGLDLYLAPGIYMGVSTRPVSVLYQWQDVIPAPGLPSLQSETTSFSFFQQTFLKLGFIVGRK